jgi:hypothetical protein
MVAGYFLILWVTVRYLRKDFIERARVAEETRIKEAEVRREREWQDQYGEQYRRDAAAIDDSVAPAQPN